MQSVWASALGSAASSADDAIVTQGLIAPLAQRDGLGQLLESGLPPAVAFLEACGGQHADAVCAATADALEGLAKAGLDAPRGATTTASASRTLKGLTRVVRSQDIGYTSRERLSCAAHAVLQHALQHLLTKADAAGGSPASIAAVVVSAASNPQRVPLLPVHALRLLCAIGLQLQSSGAVPVAGPFLERVLELLTAVATAAHDALEEEGAPGKQLAAAASEGPAGLLALVDWCRNVMQTALTSFTTGGMKGAGTGWGGGITQGAARLAVATTSLAVAIHQLASEPSPTLGRASSARRRSSARGHFGRSDSFMTATDTSPLQVEEVVDELLALAEACVTAGTAPRSSATRPYDLADKILAVTADMLAGLPPLLEFLGAQGTPLSPPLAQLKSMLLGVSATLPSVPDTAPDTPCAGPIPAAPPGLETAVPRQPGTAGQGAAALAEALAKLLADGLAVAWQCGQPHVVHAMLVPPQPSIAPPSEVKAVVQVTADVYQQLGAEPQLSRYVLPLLVDAFGSSTLAVPTPQVLSTSMALRPDVFACLATTLADMGAACASTAGGDASPWAFDQVCDVLLRAFRDGWRSAPRASDAHAAVAAHPLERVPAVTAALERLASGIRGGGGAGAPEAAARQLRNRLLVLFNDLSLAKGPKDAAARLAALLPALAAACEAASGGGDHVAGSTSGRASMSHLLSRSRFSYADIGKAQQDEGSSIKLLRTFWLHVALLGLAAPGAPLAARAALRRIATATPVLLVGLGNGDDTDLIEHLKAELSDELVAMGPTAEPGHLRGLLLSELGVAPGDPNLPPPLEVEAKAYLLAVACCELARATAPPPSDAAEGVAPCPLSVTLAYLQVTRTKSMLCRWYARIVDRAFRRYLATLDHPSPLAGEAAPAAVSGAALRPRRQACLEQLAVCLILHLTNLEAHQAGAPAQVVTTSRDLLTELLAACPALYFSQACLQALLAVLQVEEGDRPLGGQRGATSIAGAASVPWGVLRSWIYNAATAAPSFTEALLHQVLGRRPPVPTLLPAPHSSSPLYARAMHRAAVTATALTRATDLLGVVTAARAARGVEEGGLARHLDTSQALACKYYYQGLVAGLQQAQPAVAFGAHPLAAILDDLHAALNGQQPLAVLQQRYLCAAAALADAATPGGAGGGDPAAGGADEDAYVDLTVSVDLPCLADPVNAELLRSLTAVTLTKFSPEVMSLALFAWAWVTSTSPAWLLPLASRAVSAWCAAVDQGLGLFSGHSNSTGAAEAETPQLLAGLASHAQWLTFFEELWEVVAAQADGDGAPVALLLQRALHHALADPGRLSPHPAAAGPRFQLLSLGLAVVTAAHVTGGPLPAGLRLLQDRVISAGLHWFMGPASFSAHLSQQQSEEQHRRVAGFAQSLGTLLATSRAWGPTAPPSLRPPPGAHRLFVDTLGLEQEAAQPASPAPRSGRKAVLASFIGLDGVRSKAAKGGGGGYPGLGPLALPAARLLRVLCLNEAERLQVWSAPAPGAYGTAARSAPIPETVLTGKELDDAVDTAWKVSPRLAVALAGRFSDLPAIRKAMLRHLVKDVWRPCVQALPEAAIMLATSQVVGPNAPELMALSSWAPGDATAGLQLISSPAGSIPVVRAYAVRCLQNTPPAKVTFFLPQLVQCLRGDSDGAIAGALLGIAQRSDLFAHQLVWALQTEEQPPAEAFNPEVKRSGWQPPQDCGLWKVSGDVKARLLASLSPARLQYLQDEMAYFDKVTGISGILKKVEKDERRGVIAAELSKFGPPRDDLYIPTNPSCRVASHINNSGTPMQSAAKVPILVAFKVEDQPGPVPDTLHVLRHPDAAPLAMAVEQGSGGLHSVTSVTDIHLSNGNGVAVQADGRAGARPQDVSSADADPAGAEASQRTLACIFKVGDDVRQDVLALQVIQLLREAFTAAGLPAYLCPYGCLPTGYERGIIEVVPNTKSRAALGEMSDKGLYDIFQAKFGAPGSTAFETARQNFIVSEAGYAIASYLLQAKDRHNGNLLVSGDGHLVHIDFGFILEISPGGNLGFESAAFKLSHEMTQLLDPGGGRTSSTWRQFEELCVRAFLVARTVAEPIIATVALMSDSGLPCFGRGAPVANLRKRFALGLSERDAAALMRDLLNDAYQKWTTGFYDFIQALQNRIPY